MAKGEFPGYHRLKDGTPPWPSGKGPQTEIRNRLKSCLITRDPAVPLGIRKLFLILLITTRHPGFVRWRFETNLPVVIDLARLLRAQ